MAIYLIDYENTGVKGLHGIEKLQEDDLIVVFYGPKTGAVPFDDHVRISSAVSHVEYIKTSKTAKNYLDFQLTTYLGYLIAHTGMKEYCVVSKDGGYDSVVDFWKARGMSIVRRETISVEKPVKQTGRKVKKTVQKENENENIKSVPEAIRKKVRHTLKAENLQGGAYKKIYSCMLQATDKQTLNTALVRVFTQEEGNRYYKQIVPIFTEWER
ncbi:MAG: hypothetical protein J6B19_04485 [Lachnospiraceae bacterium]|nr:hypothetical protein [Lachnospiraceae bacterium]